MNNLIQGNCEEKLKDIETGSIDSVIIDPPYRYLKNQPCDVEFNEELVFAELFRVLKKDSFLIFFGRGIPLMRWGLLCQSLGFSFKEEIVWDKIRVTSPLLPLLRKHEIIYIFSKGKATFNKVYIDKIEYDCNSNEGQKIIKDLKEIISTVRNLDSIEKMQDFLNGKCKRSFIKTKHNVTMPLKAYQAVPGYHRFISHTRGAVLSSIFRVNREHYQMQHPTQKPVQLIENLVKLVSKEDDVILDCFMGSGTTGIACKNLNRKFIGMEQEKDFFNIAEQRIAAAQTNSQKEIF